MNFLEVINIASKFDAKGFKQAETALTKLSGTTKKLAGGLGVAFGASAITAYGKAAVKAFADDEAAAKRLAGAVNNLGIGFANPAIADYIASMEKSAGVADDVLRPAFQGLLTTTGSLVQSQKLLNDALTISRASGIDLATVSSDLAKGYVGITKGLSKYNTGLTKAELNSKSFAEILDVLLQRSAGAAQDYLTTTSYKFDVLSVASQNASEIIGGGLVDAFALLAGGTDAKDAAAAIETIAKGVANLERAIGRTIGAIPTLISNLKNLPKSIFGGFVAKQGGVNQATPTKKQTEATVSQKRQQELLAKLEATALKRNKELLALKNKQVAADKSKALLAKATATLGKAGDVFDLDQIQIAAALTNQAEQLAKATSGAQALQIANDTARLNVKRSILELEKAIAAGDEEAIKKAAAKLNLDLSTLSALTGQEAKLKDIKSILDGLASKSIGVNVDTTDALNKIKALYAAASSGIVIPVSLSGAAATGTTTTGTGGAVDIGGFYTAIGSNLKEYLVQSGLLTSGVSPNGKEFNYSITVNAGIGDPNAIANTIVQFLNAAKANGTLANGILNSQ